ncbi:MAG: DUF3037 domain-containing protein [Chloroflexota bacterium]|nr:DUF3037 domain-containing protein [Chloroflexota bacterium]
MWYSYATVRVVPRVEREEFLNVGIILFAREQNFLDARIELDRDRLRALAPALDLEVVERHLRSFQEICAGASSGGPLAALPPAERFHWLVAPRSTMIQTSAVHVGRAAEPRRALQDLLESRVRAWRATQEGAAAADGA